MNESVHNNSDEWNQFLSLLWRAKFFLMTGALLGVVLGFVFIKTLVPHYKSVLIVGPANPITGQESSSLLANDSLFALRYLVQRVGHSNSSDYIQFENMLTGPSVAALLLKDDKIRAVLQADKVLNGYDFEVPDNAAELSEYLKKRLYIENVGTTSLKRLVYFHADPNMGEYLLSALHNRTDFLLRNTIRNETQKRVEYLKNAVEDIRNPEHRRALTTLLLEEERLRMLVSLDQSYAAEVVEPASSSVKPQWPNVPLVYVVCIFVGAFLGLGMGQIFKSRQNDHTSANFYAQP